MPPAGRAPKLPAGDEQLFARIRAGDGQALEDLYDRYAAEAYGAARAICRDRGRAEDAVQDAFLSVWRGRETYRPQLGPVGAWLMAIVRHRAIDATRRNEKHSARRADQEHLDGRPADDDVPADVIASAEAERLQAVLTRLPEAQQEVITLAFYGQLSHTEIARRLELPPGTVKGRMRLGLHKLRDELERSA
jgi:RNA polymerase sigma-70 factor, ECF subfamily